MPPQQIVARAVSGLCGESGVTDLHQKFSIRAELEDLAIHWSVSGNPDVTLLIDMNAVLRSGPVGALNRATEGAQQIPLRVKFEDRWSCKAALRARRRLLGA